jgi:hypothetical protein
MIKDDEQAINMIDWLIEKRCPIDFVDVIGQTCLFYTARDGKLNIMCHLIKKGININHLDSYG